MSVDVLTARLSRLVDERDAANTAVDDVLANVETDGRDPSDAERDLVARYRSRLDELEPQIVDAVGDIERRNASHDASALIRPASPAPAASPSTEVVTTAPGGAPQYRGFAQYARDELICRFDAIATRAGGTNARAAAEERLTRVLANTISTDVPGLLPPQYLDDIVRQIDAARPIVETSRRVALTAGKLSYPTITQRPQVGKQAAEKTEVASRSMKAVFVDVIADTYAGAGDLSWQVINWSSPDALALWFDLAAEEYARQTEAAAGTTLAALVAGPAVAAGADLAAWMAAIAGAAGTIYAATHKRPDVVYADVATGYKLIGLVGNTSPVFLPGGSFNLATGTGSLAGLPLVISYGLPAQTVVVGHAPSLLCAETAGAPVELRAVEPSIAGMEVGVIGAFVAKVVDAAAFVRLVPAP